MKYLNLSLIPFILIIFISCSSESTTPEAGTHEFAIMAYYVPGNDIAPEKLPLNKLTHIIISFTEVRLGRLFRHGSILCHTKHLCTECC